MRRIRRSAWLWALGLCLVEVCSTSAGAQELPSYANRLLQWPKPEFDDEHASESEEKEREEFIETDRNSFTFAPFTPGDGRLIVESAYSYINIGKEGPKHSFPESVFRYGIGDRLELRFGYNYETGSAARAAEGDIAGNFGINAEQQIFYGFKYAVTRQSLEEFFMPHSAFLAQLHTPIGSVESRSQIRLGYVWGWVLANGWTLDQAVRFGTDREGSNEYSLWAPSTVLRIPFGLEKRWFTQVEYFGIISEGKEKNFSKQFVGTGLHYFITPNFEVGSTVAFGINEQTQGVVVNVGMGIRF